ncbi:Membrane-anchored ubiquitin-fold protein 1 [Platanthera zijinensis]|uniref:Membrane-anchored ubiquitin-fold protein n=2 Tax=Platanthera TaxID=59352 RepID=A0AAP0BRA6_9ASPA
MSVVQDQLEIRFRLPNGSDIGPKKYTEATTVSTLKESILAEWPKELESGPKTINDLKLINAGKILENNKTLAECRSPICDLSGITTMHVVVKPPSLERGTEKDAAKNSKGNRCRCTIL